MTAAAVGALCAAGAAPEDGALSAGLALLRSRQDAASGGFGAPPWTPVNSDTTGWVASALIQCGIDPQGAGWITAEGRTPLDYLISVQRPDGHFDWSADQPGSTVLATFDAMRPLGGTAWSTAAPRRLDPGEPAVRPAVAVAEGTTVPITLVIDHGPGADDVRMCRVDVAEGAALDEALASARQASTPAGCVHDAVAETLPGGEVAVRQVNGVAGGGGWSWWVRVDGAAAETEVAAEVGLGDLVHLSLAPGRTGVPPEAPPADPPRVAVPPLEAKPAPPAAAVVRRYPLVRLGGLLRVRGGRLLVPLRCTRASGPAGCRGVLRLGYRGGAARRVVRGALRLRYRGGAARRDVRGALRLRYRGGAARREFRPGGAAAYALRAGELELLPVRLPRPARRTLARGRALVVRLVAATRAEDALVRTTSGRRLVVPRS
jgi:hypothetical protein